MGLVKYGGFLGINICWDLDWFVSYGISDIGRGSG